MGLVRRVARLAADASLAQLLIKYSHGLYGIPESKYVDENFVRIVSALRPSILCTY